MCFPSSRRLAMTLLDPLPPPRTALLDLYETAYQPPPRPWWLDPPKTEWVSGHYRRVPNGIMGYRMEWVPGYWRSTGF